MHSDTMPLDSAPKVALKKDGSGNILSVKRTLRRSYGWPSGRQWRKIRKVLRKEFKAESRVQ